MRIASVLFSAGMLLAASYASWARQVIAIPASALTGPGGGTRTLTIVLNNVAVASCVTPSAQALMDGVLRLIAGVDRHGNNGAVYGLNLALDADYSGLSIADAGLTLTAQQGTATATHSFDLAVDASNIKNAQVSTQFAATFSGHAVAGDSASTASEALVFDLTISVDRSKNSIAAAAAGVESACVASGQHAGAMVIAPTS